MPGAAWQARHSAQYLKALKHAGACLSANARHSVMAQLTSNALSSLTKLVVPPEVSVSEPVNLSVTVWPA